MRIELDPKIFGGRKADLRRAKKAIKFLERGGGWLDLNGKRLRHDRDVVSIPIGRRFRILLNTTTLVGRVVTHEKYNRTKPR